MRAALGMLSLPWLFVQMAWWAFRIRLLQRRIEREAAAALTPENEGRR